MEDDGAIEQLRQNVIDRARWWRDHPGAPGSKLIDALRVLDLAEGLAADTAK